MRRTRHVVLPVRSWQYIGLLIVSLACLTLGLVSRDREGHAGSLAGPELTHQAPHEMDVCPNLNPFVKNLLAEPEEATKPINNHEMKVFESRVSPASRKSVLSRSMSLDRSSRSSSREIRERLSGNRDLTTRLSRSKTRVSDDRSIDRSRESRFRSITQSRDIRNSLDSVTRLSRSRGLFNRETDRHSAQQNFERRLADSVNSRLENRRSRSIERRELDEITRQNRVDRSAERRDSLAHQRRASDHRDRKSLSMERRIDRQESRQVSASRREYRNLSQNRVPNHRFGIRERRSQSVERHMSIEPRNVERSDRRENGRNLLKRSARFARKDIDHNNNLDRRNRERSVEDRRPLHDRIVNNQERRSRHSIARDSREDPVRFDERRTLSRSMERADLNHKTLSRRVRSVESNIERSDRRLSVRSMMDRREINDSGRRKAENRFVNRIESRDLVMSRISSENLRRERTNRSQNTAIRENYRTARSRYDVEEIASRKQRERFASLRSVDRNSVDRREIARIGDTTSDHNRRSREERRIVLQKNDRSSREAERRTLERRVPERRVLERQITLDSARLDARRSSERRIDSAKSQIESRLADRRLERNPESRVSRGRILERRSILNSRGSSEGRIDDGSKSRDGFKLANRLSQRNTESRVSRGRTLSKERSVLDSRRSLERRIHDDSRSREGSRMQDPMRVERNSELRNSISVQLPTERRANSRAAALENQILRSSETQREIRRLKDEHRVARSVANRPTEFRERETIRHLRRGSARNVENSSRLSSLRRVNHVQNREQRRLSTEKMLARTVGNERLFAKWEHNLQDARADKNVEARAKIVLNSMKDYEFFKYSMAYDFMRQAFIVALCTVYGLSLYNGKKSSIIGNNIMQYAQRFVFW